MKRILLNKLPPFFPERLLSFIGDAKVYDSSCSPEARVYYIEKGSGYYLKRNAVGALASEAKMTEFFHTKGLSPAVAEYFTEDYDWMITERAMGEDCTHADYLSDPTRLCDTIAERLRALHETDFTGCPVMNRTRDYINTVEQNFRTGNYDKSHFPDSFGYRSAEEAYAVFSEGKSALICDTLLHGDYCLPNILLDGWRFSAFIDVGMGGVGERHIDLFWGAWTLLFNLKTDRYRERFFDAYGRDKVDTDIIRVIAAAEVFG
ncbi:MAG: aminoglycoside 3'-phosphotransferase [Clostridia bacterium]|nr:aminoglycoside 3'-phosphotransferase [Clostridia bacterium]